MKKFTAVICIVVVLCLLIEDSESLFRRRRRRRSPPSPTCGACQGLISKVTGQATGTHYFGNRCNGCGYNCRECLVHDYSTYEVWGCKTHC